MLTSEEEAVLSILRKIGHLCPEKITQLIPLFSQTDRFAYTDDNKIFLMRVDAVLSAVAEKCSGIGIQLFNAFILILKTKPLAYCPVLFLNVIAKTRPEEIIKALSPYLSSHKSVSPSQEPIRLSLEPISLSDEPVNLSEDSFMTIIYFLGIAGCAKPQLIIPILIPLLKTDLAAQTRFLLCKIWAENPELDLSFLLHDLVSFSEKDDLSYWEYLLQACSNNKPCTIFIILKIKEFLSHENPKINQYAIYVIEKLQNASHEWVGVIDLLLEQMTRAIAKNKVNINLISALWKIKHLDSHRVVPELVALIKNYYSTHGRFHNEDLFNKIIADLSSTDPDKAIELVYLQLQAARVEAFQTLIEIAVKVPDRTIISIISSFLGDKKQAMRIGAVEALGQLGSKNFHFIVLIKPLFEDSDIEVRLKAIQAAGKATTHSEVVAEWLLPLLNHEDDKIKMEVISALGNLGAADPNKFISALIPSMNYANYELRVAAEASLRKLFVAIGKVITHPETALEWLLPFLTHKDDRIRIEVITALGNLREIDPNKVINILISFMDNTNYDVRVAVETSLGKLFKTIKHPEIEVIKLLNTYGFKYKYPCIDHIFKQVLDYPSLELELFKFINNYLITRNVQLMFTRDFKIIYAGKEYSIFKTLPNKQFQFMYLGVLSSLLPATIFINETNTLPVAASDIAEVSSIVPGANLKLGDRIVTIVSKTDKISGALITQYLLLEERTIFGDTLVYKVNVGPSMGKSFPLILTPGDADAEFKQRLFDLEEEKGIELYVNRVYLTAGEQDALLESITSTATKVELGALLVATLGDKAPEALKLPWNDYKSHASVQKLKSYELLGREPTFKELLEEERIRFATKDEVSEAILVNSEQKRKRHERAYIDSNQKLKEFYLAMNQMLYDVLNPATGIHSGAVADDNTDSLSGYAGSVGSGVCAIIDYALGPIPLLGYISKALVFAVSTGISISRSEARKRLLKVVPERTAILRQIEQVSTLATLALADKIIALEHWDEGKFGKAAGFIKRKVGITEDFASPSQKLGEACALTLLRLGLNGDSRLTAEIFASSDIIPLLVPDLSMAEFEERRKLILEAPIVEPFKIATADAGVVVNVLTLPAAGGAGAMPASVAAATAFLSDAGGVISEIRVDTVVLNVPQVAEFIREVNKINYELALHAIEAIADRVFGKANHKLRAHRSGVAARMGTKIGIKHELLGPLANTLPEYVSGLAVLGVLQKHKLLTAASITFVIDKLNLSYIYTESTVKPSVAASSADAGITASIALARSLGGSSKVRESGTAGIVSIFAGGGGGAAGGYERAMAAAR